MLVNNLIICKILLIYPCSLQDFWYVHFITILLLILTIPGITQNHSCNPNCRLYPCYINEGDIQKPLLVVFSIRDIEPDAEICFNYQGIYPGEEDDEDESLQDEESDEPKDKIYTKCLCGAENCRGSSNSLKPFEI